MRFPRVRRVLQGPRRTCGVVFVSEKGTPMESRDLELVLACQAYNYELFHRLLGGEPSAALLAEAKSDHAAWSLALAAAGYDEGAAEAGLPAESRVAGLVGALGGLDATEEQAADLCGQYVNYLAGPSKGAAQPWESVYTSHRGLLFQETTLQVRDFYRSFGCIPAEYPRVADDHVALECAFMAVLARRGAEALARGDSAEVERLLDGERRFLDEHLLVWLPRFADAIAKRPGDSVYQRAVCALTEVCAADAAALRG